MVELAQLLVSGIVLVFLGSGQDVDVVLGALVDLFVVKRVLQHVQVVGQGYLQAGVALGLVVGLQVGPGSEGADIDAAVRGCPQEAWPVGKSLHLDLKAQLFGLAALGDVLPDLAVCREEVRRRAKKAAMMTTRAMAAAMSRYCFFFLLMIFAPKS